MKVYYRFRNTRSNGRIIEDTFEHMHSFYEMPSNYEADVEMLSSGSLIIRYDCEGNKLSICQDKRALIN